jgi:hypothetical protein
MKWNWQYVVIKNGYVGRNPLNMIFGLLQGGYVGRNFVSCGRQKWGLNRQYRRLNIWPLSIWF